MSGYSLSPASRRAHRRRASRAGRVTLLPKGTKTRCLFSAALRSSQFTCRVHGFTHHSLRETKKCGLLKKKNGDHGPYARGSSYEVKPVASSTRAGFPFQVCWWM